MSVEAIVWLSIAGYVAIAMVSLGAFMEYSERIKPPPPFDVALGLAIIWPLVWLAALGGCLVPKPKKEKKCSDTDSR